ncbi:uncharacterized protein [Cherax quadricarinatus]|uniref:uncharacterized protein isoform X1 n=1 Tax=Cherax quadricarinatus TaxID=27406 RepID=UPI00387EDFB2
MCPGTNKAAAVLTWAAVGGLWVAGEDDLRPEDDLPAEHRAGGHHTDLLSDLPFASSDTFVWNAGNGSYRFGMQGDNQWRVESRDSDGTVKGRYFYRTPEGQVVDITYDAGQQGYRARGDAIPGGAAPLHHQETPPMVIQQGIETPGEVVPTDKELIAGEVVDPYGALLYYGMEETLPSGDGVITYSDPENLAIVTEVKSRPRQEAPVAVFPVVALPGFTDHLAGPPLVNDFPVLPVAIPV